jgi:hypothetical protein
VDRNINLEKKEGYKRRRSDIIFLWIGTLIWRKKKATKEADPIIYPYDKKDNSIKIKKIDLQSQPIQQTQPIHMISSDPGCSHYLGYLKDRDKSDEIPENCLTCEKLIQCSK